MLEFAKVQGKVHAEAVKQVGELAEKNPNETAAIIREWLTEAAIADRQRRHRPHQRVTAPDTPWQKPRNSRAAVERTGRTSRSR